RCTSNDSISRRNSGSVCSSSAARSAGVLPRAAWYSSSIRLNRSGVIPVPMFPLLYGSCMAQLAQQPSLGEIPVSPDRAGGDIQGGDDFLFGQSTEIT